MVDWAIISRFTAGILYAMAHGKQVPNEIQKKIRTSTCPNQSDLPSLAREQVKGG